MSVYVSDLKNLIMDNVKKSDEVIIISGFFSPDILEEIAKVGIPTTFYYGMYLKDGISTTYYNSFKTLESSYRNLKIFIPFDYHVHTKCYIFRKGGMTQTDLIGSANCSSSALVTSANSELLSPVEDAADISFLDKYADDIKDASVHFDDPAVIPTSRSKKLSPVRTKGVPKSWEYYTGNPFSAVIPLYTINAKTKSPYVPDTSGLNWGAPGHHTSKSPDMESYLTIRAFHVKNYPLLIPCSGNRGTGTGGKSQRTQSTINMIWDDGAEMKMLFQQKGVQIPTEGKRNPGDYYRQYPKALSASSGGRELGIYLRDRMNLPHNAIVTYNDLKKYGRDYVTLTLTGNDSYELDFSV